MQLLYVLNVLVMPVSQSKVFTQSTYKSIHAQSNLAIREIKLLYICWQIQQSHFGKSWFISQLSFQIRHNINKVLWLLNMRGLCDFATLSKFDLWSGMIMLSFQIILPSENIFDSFWYQTMKTQKCISLKGKKHQQCVILLWAWPGVALFQLSWTKIPC